MLFFLDFHFDLEEVLFPLYPNLRYKGKNTPVVNEKVQSLRRSSTLKLQDSGDFETEEEIFHKWALEERSNPAGNLNDREYSIEISKVMKTMID